MTPPRLTLVPKAGDDADSSPEARELARAIAETEGATPVELAGAEKLRILEAVLFASAEPLDVARLASHLDPDDDVARLLEELQECYAGRGVNLVRVAGKWAFRTAGDLSHLLERHAVEERKLSKAALETLAIVAYHQPVTRAEIEDIRGVSISAGTLDILMEANWIRPRGRRRAPGKPITYGTTDQFLAHFGLDGVKDLPGVADLKAAGLLNTTLPADFKMPDPTMAASLMPDELPLEDDEDEEQAEEAPELDLEGEAEAREGDEEAAEETEDEASDRSN